jgi:hypothetical protein
MADGRYDITIALWRGYVSACFYARGRGSDAALEVSPDFRTLRLPWERRRALEDDPGALAALATLENRLLAQGWQVRGREAGGPWYALVFTRAPRETLEPPRHAARESAAAPMRKEAPAADR